MEDDFICDEYEAEAIRASKRLDGRVVSYKRKIKDYRSSKGHENKSQAQIDWETENAFRISSDDPNDKSYTSTGEEWEIGEDW